MFGLGLAGIATLAEEATISIGKHKVADRALHIYALGFLLELGALLFIVIFGLLVPKDFFAHGFPGGFVFSPASLPTFIPRLFLELLQAYATVHAIVAADRATFGFLRTLTLPLLLGVDVILGYAITSWQIAGVILIVGSLIVLYSRRGLSKRGSFFVLVSAINAVVTLSLFKYDISHFNSVEAEQSLILLANVVFFLTLALAARQNPFALLTRPVFALQVVLSGASAMLISFAYLFAPASVITAGKRSFSVLWATLSGNIYFGEDRALIKLVCFALISTGIIMLVL